MSIEKILLDEAAAMADSLEGGVAALEAELMAVEQRRIETEAELKTAKQARTRLLDFPATSGRRLSMPFLLASKRNAKYATASAQRDQR